MPRIVHDWKLVVVPALVLAVTACSSDDDTGRSTHDAGVDSSTEGGAGAAGSSGAAGASGSGGASGASGTGGAGGTSGTGGVSGTSGASGTGGGAGSSGAGGTGGDAAIAFPDAPAGVPALARQEIAEACAKAGHCAVGLAIDGGTIDATLAISLLDLCVSDLVYSAERAIPLSGFGSRMHSPDRFVACVRDAADCAAVHQCELDRTVGECDETGCTGAPDSVTCAGEVATLVAGGSTTTRDCALARAHCSTASATGCTDRPQTSCASGTQTRCDGQVLLGCDGSGHVTYLDCARLGGTCQGSAGAASCAYMGSDVACGGGSPPAAACVGTALGLCVHGARVTLDPADLCAD